MHLILHCHLKSQTFQYSLEFSVNNLTFTLHSPLILSSESANVIYKEDKWCRIFSAWIWFSKISVLHGTCIVWMLSCLKLSEWDHVKPRMLLKLIMHIVERVLKSFSERKVCPMYKYYRVPQSFCILKTLATILIFKSQPMT